MGLRFETAICQFMNGGQLLQLRLLFRYLFRRPKKKGPARAKDLYSSPLFNNVVFFNT